MMVLSTMCIRPGVLWVGLWRWCENLRFVCPWIMNDNMGLTGWKGEGVLFLFCFFFFCFFSSWHLLIAFCAGSTTAFMGRLNRRSIVWLFSFNRMNHLHVPLSLPLCMTLLPCSCCFPSNSPFLCPLAFGLCFCFCFLPWRLARSP